MRLIEIKPDFVRSQTGMLMTVIQQLKTRVTPGTEVPFTLIAKLMANLGVGFTYEAFKKLYDSNPKLQGMVSNFNQETITVGKSPDPVNGDDGSAGQDDASATVDDMAKKSAANINK